VGYDRPRVGDTAFAAAYVPGCGVVQGRILAVVDKNRFGAVRDLIVVAESRVECAVIDDKASARFLGRNDLECSRVSSMGLRVCLDFHGGISFDDVLRDIEGMINFTNTRSLTSLVVTTLDTNL